MKNDDLLSTYRVQRSVSLCRIKCHHVASIHPSDSYTKKIITTIHSTFGQYGNIKYEIINYANINVLCIIVCYKSMKLSLTFFIIFMHLQVKEVN